MEVLVQKAAEYGMPALAMTDHNSLAGAVQFVRLCRAYQIKPILGAELTLSDQSHLTLLAKNKEGYANLCRMISCAYQSGGRLSPAANFEEIASFTDGLICLTGCRKGRVSTLAAIGKLDEAANKLQKLCESFGRDNTYVELIEDSMPGSASLNQKLIALAKANNVSLVATNNVHYAAKADFILHDILRCVDANITVAEVHTCRSLNAELYLKSPAEMARLFSGQKDALVNTLRIAERCFDGDLEKTEITPFFNLAEGQSTAGYLRQITEAGATSRYPCVDHVITERIDHELDIIHNLGYDHYFLMAHKVVNYARSQKMRVTGRGSAADSIVAYCLWLTDVDVIKRRLPFARFVAPGKVPDIDIDVDRLRRDELFQWLKCEYGEEQVAVCCTFHRYQAKGALRDIGKALALPQNALRWFSQYMNGFISADRVRNAFDHVAELKPYAGQREQFALLFDLCGKIADFPRHMGSHSSGVVISRVPLWQIAGMTPSARGILPITMLDKDDIEEIGAIKLDLLCLPNHSMAADAEEEIQKVDDSFSYDAIPEEDKSTYDLLQSGKAMGVFQLQSPAQMALACTLRPDTFEDLTASIALIRPGPIKTEAVRRFCESRNGWRRIAYLHYSLIPILERTFGCVIFQEQVIQVIAVLMGVSDGEADQIRKSLAKMAKRGTLGELRAEFLARSRRVHGDLPEANANEIWTEIEGWSGLGFVEGHSASFALNAYKSAFMATHHASAFFCGLLNNQPVGYYAPNSLCAEARRRGVQILPLDINVCDDKCHATPDTIRIGLRMVDGLPANDIERIVIEQRKRPFSSLLDFCTRVPLHQDRLESLVLAGAFDSLHAHRRGILWRLNETSNLARSLRAENAGGNVLDFEKVDTTPIAWEIPAFTQWEEMMWEWRVLGMTTGCHALSYVREYLKTMGIMTAAEASKMPHRTRVTVAGVNVRPHRPGTRSGRPVLFTTIEDETDFLQATCFGETIDRYTTVFLLSLAVIVRGTIEKRGLGASLMVEKAKPLILSQAAKIETSLSIPIKAGHAQSTSHLRV
jgi:error-prone DNA polymerase